MRWLLVLALSGCSSILGIEDFKVGDAGGPGDDATEMGYCLGPTGWRICLPMQPTTPITISGTGDINTQVAPGCLNIQPPSWKAAGQPDACILIGSSIVFDAATMQVTGNRPLVVFAADTITITERIEVASHSPSTVGPAANPPACTAPGAATANPQGAGGGAGGSFMGRGGKGGNSSGNAPGGAQAPPDAMPPQILRGGCNGGAGGNSNNVGGRAGAGGGSVYLVAGNRIVVNGVINASGGSGAGGGILAGGGGGGSGGMIVLHAPMIGGTNGRLIANGGGGGGGGSPNNSGSSGSEPQANAPTMQASGGPGGGAGGAGFAGSAVATDGQNGSPVSANAGGGGGGAQGYIRANVAPVGLVASPAVSVVN